MNSFGLCLEFGTGVEKDLCRTVEYFCKAANLGHAGAQNNFGFYLQHGLETEINLTEALTITRSQQIKIAESVHFAVHCVFIPEFGIDANLEEAGKYYQLA